MKSEESSEGVLYPTIRFLLQTQPDDTLAEVSFRGLMYPNFLLEQFALCYGGFPPPVAAAAKQTTHAQA